MSEATSGCNTCNKSVLSLFLLRPSIVALDKALEPAGADQVKVGDALIAGLIPERKPSESRYVLRLLRAGYVHIYTPEPPAGIKQWRVFRITDEADCVPEENAWFNQPDTNVACPKPGHNSLGMKIIDIPMAHKITEVWVAYSANLWSKKLRGQNAANPKAMQKIVLAGGSANTFAPTPDNLKGKVLECALDQLWINGSKAHDFQFNSLVGKVDSLAKQLERLAALHPKTKGKQLAVVLRDPVGLAAELNALRLRRHELATRDIEKPEVAHPLNSSNTLMGIKQAYLDANLAKSWETISPVMSQGAFTTIMRVKPNPRGWPAGTEWVPLEDTRENRMQYGWGMGRVVFPDHDARAAAWAKQQTEATWAPIASKFDDDKRTAWMAKFEDRMKRDHYEPLAKYETDWLAAVQDAATLTYFDLHFDENDPNDPKQNHSPGRLYAQENQYIHKPAPITGGPVLDVYLALADKPFRDKTGIIQRALIGNQKSLFDMVEAFLAELADRATTAPGIGEGKRDKAYDLMKGLLEGAHEAEHPNAAQVLLKKYSWLGDALAAFSLGQLSALSGGALGATMRSSKVSPKLMKFLGRLQGLWAVHRALEFALQGALSGKAPKVPVMVKARIPISRAMEIWRARKGQDMGVSHSQLKRQRGGLIEMTLLTDTDAIKAAQGDLDAVLKDPKSGQVGMKGAAGTLAAGGAGGSVVLTEEQFAKLWREQTAQAGKEAADAVRDFMRERTTDIRAIAKSLNGRLAIGTILVQGLGIVYGIRSLMDAKTEEEVRDAWYGLYDSGAGVLGGTLEVFAVAVESRVAARAGADAVERSLGIGLLRFGADLAGAAGGIVNAVASWAKMKDAMRQGEPVVARLYFGSVVAFTGMGAAYGAAGASGLAKVLARRALGGAAGRAILTRIGGAGAVEIFGLTASGWGLVLLGAGVIFQVWAVVVSPTPIQEWAKKSYFGRATEDKYKDWPAESAGLENAIGKSLSQAEPAKAASEPAGNAQIDDIMIAP